MLKSRIFAALSVALIAVAGNAVAGEANGSFDVTASVEGSCIVSSTEAIAFGSYDPTVTHATAALTSTGKVSVRCTAGLEDVSVALDQGANAATGSTCAAPLRQLNSDDNVKLSYTISASSGGSDWGCDEANAQIIESFASSLVPVELTTYGSIAGGQNAAVGDYTDTIGVTVTF